MSKRPISWPIAIQQKIFRIFDLTPLPRLDDPYWEKMEEMENYYKESLENSPSPTHSH